MKATVLLGIGVMALSAAPLFPPSLIAQSPGDEHGREGARHRYKLVDLGTFGGPISYGFSMTGPGERHLNNAGTVSSYADFATPDPNAPDHCFDPDCLLAHAFRWRHGRLTDLGALDDRYNSAAGSINDRGWDTGQSQTGLVLDSPQIHAVLWKGRKIVDLDTLPGGSASLGVSVNNAGQVVGLSNNGVSDPFSTFGVQIRTFFSQDGSLQDIGTLGGPDAISGPGCDNQRPGVIVGSSYTSYTPNPGSGIPTQDPFL
jgi:hypothetical protein